MMKKDPENSLNFIQSQYDSLMAEKETLAVRVIHLQSVSWSLAEFRHNKIVQSPHENYFNVCRQHKEKWDLVKMTIIQTG